MERSTMLLIVKPSISMGHLYHGYVTNNQRVTTKYRGLLQNFLSSNSVTQNVINWFQYHIYYVLSQSKKYCMYKTLKHLYSVVQNGWHIYIYIYIVKWWYMVYPCIYIYIKNICLVCTYIHCIIMLYHITSYRIMSVLTSDHVNSTRIISCFLASCIS